MITFTRAVRHSALLLPLVWLAPQASAQTADADTVAAPKSLQTGDETPWIYEGSDVPQDKEWLFGKMDNGLRYAVRHNGVPPGQVSIRIRIDAGSLYEKESERGFAHLLEHLSFRESKYLAQGAAIPTWQRLGATFGSDTNAETSPTQTVYKLDLPNATPAKIEESFKLLSGMMRAPVLSAENVAAEVPIVLAEKRERGGPAVRVGEKSRETLFTGQLLADRLPIGTDKTLKGATAQAVQAFQQRWYRPDNTVVVVAGDFDPMRFAGLVEKYFGDWQGKGARTPAPDFGDPVAPVGVDPANPVGEVAVMTEPDLPRTFSYAYLRPWRQVKDTVEYNERRLADLLAVAIIQRRLEARARAGGSFLYASVQEDNISRSANLTSVSFAPLTKDWQAALSDVRAIIADAMTTPPTQEEIEREAAQYDSIFVSLVEQRSVMAGSSLADEVVGAVDIRESVAAPETFLQVFRGMKNKITPQDILEHTQALFKGNVIRATYVTPAIGEATEASIQAALKADVVASTDSRLEAKSISFDQLPPVGKPGTIVSQAPLGVLDIQRVEFANGARALLWSNKAEPGRVSVRLRFGAGYRAFEPGDTAYIRLGEMALVGSGQGELGQEELDRITTGRIMGFNFEITDSTFAFSAQTRDADLNDQLYLFADKLSDPRWDPNPVIRSKAAQRLAYESLATSPGGVLQRDLEFLLTNRDGRFKTADLADLAAATPEGFRKVWAPILAQGDVEIIIFGDFDQAAAIESLRKTIGALPSRKPIAPDVLARVPDFPSPGKTIVRTHRGDANQAAAVVAWPTGGGVAGLQQSRQLQILVSVFNNRLIDVMREKAGASYSPQVGSIWPIDMNGGGRITAIAQLKPEDVPVFFAAAETIAQDLANNPPSADELARATEPLKQQINRASTGNLFWLYQIEGSSADPRRLYTLQSLRSDYSETTPERMLALAKRYLGSRPGWQMAIIPEGQKLATAMPSSPPPAVRLAPATSPTPPVRPVPTGR